MDITTHKKVVGSIASLFLALILAPAVFWLICAGIDRAFGCNRLVGQPWSAIVTAACALIGIFWILWAWSYLLYVGRGLPLEVFGRALHPTQVLVATGPYAYTRNPMVLGLLFLLLAVAFFRGTLSGFILVPLIGLGTWIYLVGFEEKGLVERFGDSYEHYRSNVPILFPRISAYAHIPSVE